METITLRALPRVEGVAELPASKSISNRVLLIDRLAGGDGSLLERLADCDDTRAVLTALADTTGAKDIGAAGTAMRFLTAYYALTPGTVSITGTERMRHRPIAILAEALRRLGGKVDYLGEEGFPPLRIEGGHLRGGSLRVDGSVSSQYVSALLMIAPCLPEGLSLEFTGEVASRPYIDMTLSLMRQFGADAAWAGEDRIRVLSGGYRARRYRVESDWSAASYWYEMVSVASLPGTRVELPGLSPDSLQGDSEVARWFGALGVTTEFTEKGATLTRGGEEVRSLALDFARQPDLAQTLVTTCCIKGIPFLFTGLESLKIKETDRVAALIAECAKLGYRLEEPAPGQLRYAGGRGAFARPARVATYDDHRMAMAFAPFAMSDGELVIENPGVVSKSYPGFWRDWENCVSSRIQP